MALTSRHATFPARLSYNDLFVPRAANEGADPKYQAVLLVPKDDAKTIGLLQAAINEAVKDGVARGKIKAPIDPQQTLYPPLRDGDKPKNDGESRGEAFAGHLFVSAKANADRKPFIVDQQAQPLIDTEEIYSGCYVNACVEFYVYASQGNVGVAATIVGVQKVKDGERLGAAPVTAEDVFSALGGSQAVQPAVSPNLGF